MSKMTCPDCQGAMVAGTLVERGDYNYAKVPEWVEGPLDRSLWTGQPKNAVRLEVTAYRCAKCGYLKLYAKG
jgi:hypothetical protein